MDGARHNTGRRSERVGEAGRQVGLLAACIGLQMTSFVMILPLFARRFAELGAGVRELGVSEMAYAIAAMLAAPFMGALADKVGRRPVVLGSLAMYAIAFTGYWLAQAAWQFILIRGLTGALTAGLMPAATGMVADLSTAERRARWIGVLSAGASIGWIVGPVLGGLLFDRWGYSRALITSVGMTVLSLVVAAWAVRETRGGPAPKKSETRIRFPSSGRLRGLRGAYSNLRGSLRALWLVLFIYFIVMFAWAFMEPRFMFHAYDELHWTSSTLGLVMSTYGFALVVGELTLSHLSDRFGRGPVIVVGMVCFSAQFLGLAFSANQLVIGLSFVIAGLGNALFDPALSASVLDKAPEKQQSQLLGVKSTLGSLGSLLGPAGAVVLTGLLRAQGFFVISAIVVLIAAAMAVIVGVGARPRVHAAEASARSSTP